MMGGQMGMPGGSMAPGGLMGGGGSGPMGMVSMDGNLGLTVLQLGSTLLAQQDDTDRISQSTLHSSWSTVKLTTFFACSVASTGF
jgi:hypothetical protein